MEKDNLKSLRSWKELKLNANQHISKNQRNELGYSGIDD